MIKNKKILILGGNGMLGKDMIRAFINNDFKNITYSTRKKPLDRKFLKNKNVKFLKLSIDEKIEKNISKFLKNKFEIVINCIGIVKPRINEEKFTSFKNTINVNSLFPKILQDSMNKKTKIYQIATDCVYSGKEGHYDEKSYHDANDLYGKSKSLGEINASNFYNLRCSIIGKELNNKYSLVEWFLSNKNMPVNGFVDHHWNGVSTTVFSNLVCSIIINKIKIPNNFHIVPKNIVTKYSLLKYLNKRFENNSQVSPFKSKFKINRTLSTIFNEINDEMWNKSIYGKKMSIKEIVNTL